MKRIAIIALALNLIGVWPSVHAQAYADGAVRGDVKTVQLYRQGAELDFPILPLGSGRMLLEFDVLGTEPEELRWRIVHCDRHWQPDELQPVEFLTGFAEGTIESYDFSFTTLRDYVHYTATVPGDFAEFTYSGNYVVEVTGGEEVLLRKRFCVSEGAVKTEATVGRPYDGVDLERRQEVDVRVLAGSDNGVPAVSLRPEYLCVTVQQNGREDNRRELTFSGYDGTALAYRYRQCNIFEGGNTFRYFDCSNLRAPMYNVARVEEYGGEQFAILRPEEDRSKKHYLSETTLAGGMKVNIWDRKNPRLEADYVWVNFSLPMAQPMLEGTVHVVGALTDWRTDSTSAMEYNPRYKAYTLRLLLKQGYYAYQLLVVSRQRTEASTAHLEGNHRESPNRYTVTVYYRSPADRADRLVGVTKTIR
ncbi:MAG: DUF5103 domain-containing protein [Bacteroidales bacterium]|nr:DUF5103 domain-containing protein [Bacteroidales bacterium]